MKKVLNATKIEIQDGFFIPTVREMLCEGMKVILKCLIFNCCREVASVKKIEIQDGFFIPTVREMLCKGMKCELNCCIEIYDYWSPECL